MGQIPEAITEYLIHFHGSRDWFECHEILEEYWKEHPDSAYSDTLVGLIQIAVGLYHERRGNLAGAVKMLRSSLSRLGLRQLEELGLDGERLTECVRARTERLEAAAGGKEGGDGTTSEFVDLDLPFANTELEAQCRDMCEARGWQWKGASPLQDDDLIHRHTRRDRSGVVREREESLRRRKGLTPP